MKAEMLNHTSVSSIFSYNYLSDFNRDLYSLLSESQEWYPDICDWYFQKFIPGLNNGSRNILIYLIDNKVAGIALLKNECDEKKICTFKVNKPYRNNGIGKLLFEKCMEILETDRPMITIPSERLCYFSTILEYYNIKVEQVIHNYYRSKSTEFVFNGYLDTKNTPCPYRTESVYEKSPICFNQFLPNYREALKVIY